MKNILAPLFATSLMATPAMANPVQERCFTTDKVAEALARQGYQPLIIATDDEANIGYMIATRPDKTTTLITIIEKNLVCVAAISRPDEIKVNRKNIEEFLK